MVVGREKGFFEEKQGVESGEDGGDVVFLSLYIPKIEEQDEGSEENLLCGSVLLSSLTFSIQLVQKEFYLIFPLDLNFLLWRRKLCLVFLGAKHLLELQWNFRCIQNFQHRSLKHYSILAPTFKSGGKGSTSVRENNAEGEGVRF